MSDAQAPANPVAEVPPQQRKLVNELKASANLMALDAGLYCILHAPAKQVDMARGLPGVRVTAPPGPSGRPEAVLITTARPDGWLTGLGDAALVRVGAGGAQVLVTVYQAVDAPAENAPNVQVMRLVDAAAQSAAITPPPSAGGPAPDMAAAGGGQRVVDMVAHIQGQGDVGAVLGEWLGEKGSKRWIEGFAVAPTTGIASGDIEYQAVLGRGWLSPWVEGGQFCGSRGMALPVLGMKLRLRGDAAKKFTLRYIATFVDGAEIGPVGDGEACEAESLAAMESFRIELLPRGGAQASAAPAPKTARAPKVPAARPVAPRRR